MKATAQKSNPHLKPAKSIPHLKPATSAAHPKRAEPNSHPKHTKSTPHLKRIVQIVAISLVIILTGLTFITISRVTAQHERTRTIARLQELSNHDSGSTYSEVVNNIQANMPEYEIIFIFDENNQKLIEYTSRSSMYVSLPKEAINLLQTFKNLQHYHTHPIHDNPHSDNDLSMLARVGLAANVNTLGVIGANHVYTLISEDYAWPVDYIEIWQYGQFLNQQYGPLVDAGFMQTVIVDGEEYPYLTTKFLQQFATDFGYTCQIQTSSQSTSYPGPAPGFILPTLPHH